MIGKCLWNKLTQQMNKMKRNEIEKVAVELSRAAGPTAVVGLTRSGLCAGRREQAFAYSFLAWLACAPLHLLLLCTGGRDHRRSRLLAHDMAEAEASPPSMLLAPRGSSNSNNNNGNDPRGGSGNRRGGGG